MSPNKFIIIDPLALAAMLAAVLALSACAAGSSRPASQQRDCEASMDQPDLLCDASAG